jgi:hypothetical protein
MSAGTKTSAVVDSVVVSSVGAVTVVSTGAVVLLSPPEQAITNRAANDNTIVTFFITFLIILVCKNILFTSFQNMSLNNSISNIFYIVKGYF